MTIPSRVRVMGTDWKVAVKDDFKDGDDDPWALTKQRYQSIEMDSQTEQPVTLIHELLHAVEFGMDAGTNEALVSMYSRGLVAILRDNPRLRAWLWEQFE